MNISKYFPSFSMPIHPSFADVFQTQSNVLWSRGPTNNDYADVMTLTVPTGTFRRNLFVINCWSMSSSVVSSGFYCAGLKLDGVGYRLFPVAYAVARTDGRQRNILCMYAFTGLATGNHIVSIGVRNPAGSGTTLYVRERQIVVIRHP